MFSALFNSLNFLVGPIWEIVIVGGGVLAALLGVWFNGKSQGKKSERAKFHKADREGAANARKTADQIYRDTSEIGRASCRERV